MMTMVLNHWNNIRITSGYAKIPFLYLAKIYLKTCIKICFLTLRAIFAFGGLIRLLFMDVAHIFTLKTTFKNCATKILIKALYLLGYIDWNIISKVQPTGFNQQTIPWKYRKLFQNQATITPVSDDNDLRISRASLSPDS